MSYFAKKWIPHRLLGIFLIIIITILNVYTFSIDQFLSVPPREFLATMTGELMGRAIWYAFPFLLLKKEPIHMFSRKHEGQRYSRLEIIYFIIAFILTLPLAGLIWLAFFSL